MEEIQDQKLPWGSQSPVLRAGIYKTGPARASKSLLREQLIGNLGQRYSKAGVGAVSDAH